jgi:YHS domain-containing protein
VTRGQWTGAAAQTTYRARSSSEKDRRHAPAPQPPRHSRRAAAAVAVSVLPLAAAQASEIFTTGGLAIRGYDPVAYHTENKPVKGAADFESVWKGAVWRFASAENKAKFDTDPEQYAPAYGGYCAYAVAYGSTAKTEPDAFSIVDGKLYLNFDKRIQSKWEADIPGFLKKSEQNWPGIEADLKG